MSILPSTWWGLAEQLRELGMILPAIDPRKSRLEIDGELARMFAPEALRKFREDLQDRQAVFDKMLLISRSPSPTFPTLPGGFDDSNAHAITWSNTCVRALGCDASLRFERGEYGPCVARIETMAGLSRHCLSQPQSMWVINGASFLRLTCDKIRTFEVALRSAPSQRASLGSALAAIEELDPMPWPKLMGEEIRARGMHPDFEWRGNMVAGLARSELREAIAMITG